MLTVKRIIEKFDLKVVAGESKIDNVIEIHGLNRGGIELSGNTVDTHLKRIVLLGTKEKNFLDTLSDDIKVKRYRNLIEKHPPAIIISSNYEDAVVANLCEEYNIPLLKSSMGSSEITITIGNYLSEQLVKRKTIHGTLMEIYGEGILILGESGIGKSEIAMELIKKGHMFIADDAVAVGRIGGSLNGIADAVAKNFIEVRGLGILNVSRMFGIEKIKSQTNIMAVVELIRPEKGNQDFERIGSSQNYKSIEGVNINYYKFPVTPGRKISDLIESAVVDLKLKREGYNSANEFMLNLEKVKNEQ
jgi:HPr kinase/phosphorylase